MAKVGLVFVDVPKNCEECQFNYDYMVCMANDGVPDPLDPNGERRPIGCPIKVYEVRTHEENYKEHN